MPFFSPPAQVDDAGLRVTEDALYRWIWSEARKAVGVPQASVCSHPAIMPDFQISSNAEFTPLSLRKYCFSRSFTHSPRRRARIHTIAEHRVCYVAKFGEAIYVLHAFEKRTRKTSQHDVELARQRYQALVAQH
jgi:hypothetical protein